MDSTGVKRMASNSSAATIRFVGLDEEKDLKEELSGRSTRAKTVNTNEDDLSPVPMRNHVFSRSSSLRTAGSPGLSSHVQTAPTLSSSAQDWLSGPVAKPTAPHGSSVHAERAHAPADYAEELRKWSAKRQHHPCPSAAASLSPLPPSSEVATHTSHTESDARPSTAGVASSNGERTLHVGEQPQQSARRSLGKQRADLGAPIVDEIDDERGNQTTPLGSARKRGTTIALRRMLSHSSTNEASDRTVRPLIVDHHSPQSSDALACGSNSESHGHMHGSQPLKEVMAGDEVAATRRRDTGVAAYGTATVYHDLAQNRLAAPQADLSPLQRSHSSGDGQPNSSDITKSRAALPPPTPDRAHTASPTDDASPPLPSPSTAEPAAHASRQRESFLHHRDRDFTSQRPLSSSLDPDVLRSIISDFPTTPTPPASSPKDPACELLPPSGTTTSVAFRTATENGSALTYRSPLPFPGEQAAHSHSVGTTSASVEKALREHEEQLQRVPVTRKAVVMPSSQAMRESSVRKQPAAPLPVRIDLPEGMLPPRAPTPVHHRDQQNQQRGEQGTSAPPRESSSEVASEVSSFASIKYWRQVVAVEGFLAKERRATAAEAVAKGAECRQASPADAARPDVKRARPSTPPPQHPRQVSGVTNTSSPTTVGTTSSRRRLSEQEAAGLFGRFTPYRALDAEIDRKTKGKKSPPLIVSGMVAALPSGNSREDKRYSTHSTNDTFGVGRRCPRENDRSVEAESGHSRKEEPQQQRKEARSTLLRDAPAPTSRPFSANDDSPTPPSPPPGSSRPPTPPRTTTSTTSAARLATASNSIKDAGSAHDGDDDDDGAHLVISLIAQRVGAAGQALLTLGQDLAVYQQQALAENADSRGSRISTPDQRGRRRA